MTITLTDEQARMVREALKDGLLSASADCDSSHERTIETALTLLDGLTECNCHAHSWEEHADGCPQGDDK